MILGHVEWEYKLRRCEPNISKKHGIIMMQKSLPNNILCFPANDFSEIFSEWNMINLITLIV